MFGKLKEKLKDAMSVFSKKAEEEADVVEEVEKQEVAEDKEVVEEVKEEKKSKKERNKKEEKKPEKKKEEVKETLAEEKTVLEEVYENKHKEVYGDTQSDSAFLFSLIINTFVVGIKNWGEVKNTPSDIKRHEKILDMLIEHIKEDDPIIPLLIHYSALVLTHASKENKKDDHELFWCGSHTLDTLISSLKHHHITKSSPADIVTLFKNLRKPPLSIDLTHKLQSIINYSGAPKGSV